MSVWLLIVILAVITYLSRVVAIESLVDKHLHPVFERYLRLIGPAVLSSLLVSQLITTGPQAFHVALSLPVTMGVVMTILTSRKTGNFLLSVIVGVICGLIMRTIISA